MYICESLREPFEDLEYIVFNHAKDPNVVIPCGIPSKSSSCRLKLHKLGWVIDMKYYVTRDYSPRTSRY